MEVGDTIKIVQSRPRGRSFCIADSWYIHSQEDPNKDEAVITYLAPTYYLYKDYEGSVGVILSVGRNDIYCFDFYVVLIGNKKIICLECVMESIK